MVRVWLQSDVIRHRRGEASVAIQSAGQFVVAYVIHGRGGEHHVRAVFPDDCGHTAVAVVVVADGQILNFEVQVIGSEESRSFVSFFAALTGDFDRTKFRVPFVAGSS